MRTAETPWGKPDRGIIDGKNPRSHVERMHALPSGECCTRAEVERLLTPEHLDPRAAVALYTSLRCREIAGLTWECGRCDLGRLDGRRSFAGPTKNGKPCSVSLHPELVPILTGKPAALRLPSVWPFRLSSTGAGRCPRYRLTSPTTQPRGPASPWLAHTYLDRQPPD